MPSQTAEKHPRTASSQEFELFCASMADGLHALAQPLTILRSSIVAANGAGITQERQRYYLEISRNQVERACELFESLQQRMIVAQSLADRSATDPGEEML